MQLPSASSNYSSESEFDVVSTHLGTKRAAMCSLIESFFTTIGGGMVLITSYRRLSQ
jgi:hypothetical protein